MTDWLLLGADQKEDWVRRILEKRPSVMWLDRIPASKDLEDRELIVEAFSAKALKEKSLQAIAHFLDYRGPVASVIGSESTTLWAVQSGLHGRLIGFQLCPSPDNVRSIELLKGEITDGESLRLVQKAFEEIGFLVAVCRDQAGGILPRVLAAMINEAAYMALCGIATVEEIDRMMRLGANFPMGPLEWADRIGLDRVLVTLERMAKELGQQYHPCPCIRRKVEAGHLGVKAGRGFYERLAGGVL